MVIKPSGRDACINFLNRVIQKYEDKGLDSMYLISVTEELKTLQQRKEKLTRKANSYTDGNITEGKGKFFLELSRYTVGNAYEGDKKELEEFADEMADYGSVGYKGKAYPASGLNAGGEWAGDEYYYGGKIISVSGLDMKMNFDYSDAFGTREADVTLKTTFLGLMFNIGKRQVIGNSYVDLVVGAGFAQGKTKSKWEWIDTGAYAGNSGVGSDYTSWNGLTYEFGISYYIVFTRRVDIFFSLKYFGFPERSKSDDWCELKWSPISYSVGLRF